MERVRAVQWAYYEREVDPDGVLSPEERQRRAKAAQRAHMQLIALKSSRKRAARKRAEK
jgi:hypothetical protein